MSDILYARVVAGIVQGAPISLPDTLKLGVDLFTPDEAALYHACPAGVGDGWTFDGTNFAAPSMPVPSMASLLVYANIKQWGLATGGYTMTLSGQALTFSTDTASQALITGKYIRLTQANPPATISWQFPGGFVAISMADFQKVASAIADFIQATFDALAQVMAAIKAGTITTTAQVDAAAWPSAVALG